MHVRKCSRLCLPLLGKSPCLFAGAYQRRFTDPGRADPFPPKQVEDALTAKLAAPWADALKLHGLGNRRAALGAMQTLLSVREAAEALLRELDKLGVGAGGAGAQDEHGDGGAGRDAFFARSLPPAPPKDALALSVFASILAPVLVFF